jgi:ABC-type lipoprotein release transport system permease subunit
VINESFARRFFVGGDPLGMHISLVNDDGHATFEVIGVANDARTNRLRGEIAPFGASRVIASQLYGVTPHDSLTLVVATALLLVVAFCSSYLPAHRASRVDAMAALRQS